MSEKEPDIIYIRKGDKESFARLQEEDSPFRSKENKDLFIMAMAIGFNEGKRIEIGPGERISGGYFRTSYLTDREKALIKAVAVADSGDFDVIANKKRVYEIAESYAAGGIESLKRSVLGGKYEDYSKKLEVALLELLKKTRKEGDESQ
jgi:hypothetical protein